MARADRTGASRRAPVTPTTGMSPRAGRGDRLGNSSRSPDMIVFDGAGDLLQSNGSFDEFAEYPAVYGQESSLSDDDRTETGVPRQIEIWFVVYNDRFYLIAETGESAAWVKNIRRNS